VAVVEKGEADAMGFVEGNAVGDSHGDGRLAFD